MCVSGKIIINNIKGSRETPPGDELCVGVHMCLQCFFLCELVCTVLADRDLYAKFSLVCQRD